MALTKLHEQLIRELVGKGMPHDKARTVVELAEHARSQMMDTMMRVYDSAGDGMNLETLLVTLALLDITLAKVKEECEAFVLAMAFREEL
jgi:hypothetical protein